VSRRSNAQRPSWYMPPGMSEERDGAVPWQGVMYPPQPTPAVPPEPQGWGQWFMSLPYPSLFCIGLTWCTSLMVRAPARAKSDCGAHMQQAYMRWPP